MFKVISVVMVTASIFLTSCTDNTESEDTFSKDPFIQQNGYICVIPRIYGRNRYVKVITKDGKTYAVVIVPDRFLLNPPGEKPTAPGRDEHIARIELVKTPGIEWCHWARVKIIREKGYTFFVFKRMTEGEIKEAGEVVLEMAKPIMVNP